MPAEEDTTAPKSDRTAAPEPTSSAEQPLLETEFGYGRGLSDSANQSDEQGDQSAVNQGQS
jgi:hypothetical protein